MNAQVDPSLLAALRRARRPSGPPLAHPFRTTYADRWVRFRSLPDSKRCPESADEHAIVLDRWEWPRAPCGTHIAAPSLVRAM
ncbi:hypothetical protein ABZ557_05385 [Streptomyces sp. NPDC019645]|uniref:hypothetical protein n=1 Tax=Streptomyces sp. NPDC019645 TaxID=3154786 RepID=UPI0033DA2B94